MFEMVRNPVALTRRINAYSFAAGTPPELEEALQTIGGVDADKISQGREILWAHYDLLSEDGRKLLGQLADYAVYSGWSGDNAGGRCEEIVAAVRRDLDAGGDWKPTEDDPQPRTRLRKGEVDWRLPPKEG